ncbi:hypothetical protein DWU98_14915 [Dyella monticola]|uniref:Peptidase S1 domain-containing protein n=1 Tax=Dyella monticola TaxID=1927958 RepID=A0A370WW00_9GAMM|nr:trypsin-like peptidase domain-containing protein [Dyella monticola]RDS80197.1 hypothetical protein DWU98_14915 [Dyella monticola]
MQKLSLALLGALALIASGHSHAQEAFCPGDDQICISPEGPGRAAIVDFWTEDRMKEAWTVFGHGSTGPDNPLDPGADFYGYTLVPPSSYLRPPHALTGILFFEEPGSPTPYKHCSASVIRSAHQNLILTAAHCMRSTASSGTWHRNLMFVPAYSEREDGVLQTPYEKWPVEIAFLPFASAAISRYADIAVARVYALPSVIGPDRTLESVVGGSLQPRMSTASVTFPLVRFVGYPGLNGFNLVQYPIAAQRQCETHTYIDDADEATARMVGILNCSPQSGNSGGPIVQMPGNPGGYDVVGVMAYIDMNPQPRLLPETFLPIYQAANDGVAP